RYSASVIDEPRPAPASMKTSCPLSTSSLTPAGVMATRYSWFLTSAGMPTFMVPPNGVTGECEPSIRHLPIMTEGYSVRSQKFVSLLESGHDRGTCGEEGSPRPRGHRAGRGGSHDPPRPRCRRP